MSVSAGVEIQAAGLACSDVLARLHQSVFEDSGGEIWDAAAFAALLGTPGTSGAILSHRSEPAGLVLTRAAAGEAEILTLGVLPERRGQGFGQMLVSAARESALQAGAETLFLEVAADNGPAIALYKEAGFEKAGLRKGYYRRGTEAQEAVSRVDALVMRCKIV